MKRIALILLLHIAPLLLMCQTVIPLYKDSIPNSKPSKNEEKSEQSNGILIISKISIPTLSIYLPSKQNATGTAVVICPGGGYSIVAAGHEGADIAKTFTDMGVAAFVVKYRIPNIETMIDPEIGPLQDAQQAIKIVREGAKQWNVNSAKVGIMGFSAGGHLASTAGTHFSKSVISNPNNTSLRPDFMLLIYPVISFADSIGHMGSRDNLIGKNPSAQKIIEYSNELQVNTDTPPTFLVHASDDDAVKPQNSIVFYQALLKNHVAAEMHLYETGGHGFGLNLKNKNEHWMERCKNWMQNHGW
ncbi:alpha/beta hydrolase [Ferruginibacter sp.]|uniref:alpha/beta hydrolase n=1 Tax=Ferruginibacter sp. TaxID=1940288 RepID=UPI001987BB53|nr:alpha/beta hydrolase [Ferruginibacter sp.]MBC7626738.1 alpha/beta hydrolase [Ferruginibacter sp.]